MDHEVIIAIAYAVLGVIGFVLGKFVFPKVPKGTMDSVMGGFELLVNYADKFVVWAKQFLAAESGEDKMKTVVSELAKIAERYKIEVSEAELQAIAQKAYEEMKRGEHEAELSPVLITSGNVVANPIETKDKE